MTEYRLRADSQQCRGLTSERLRRGMTHRVDTPVCLQKPSVREHPVNGSGLDARREKLPPGYKAPLEPGDRRNPLVARAVDRENVPQAKNRHEDGSIVTAIRGRSNQPRSRLRGVCVFPRLRPAIRIHGRAGPARQSLTDVVSIP